MKRTENLNLPIYDNPESDIFKINDVNNAHKAIDKQYKELKNIKETVESTNPSANLQGQINDINASLDKIDIKKADITEVVKKGQVDVDEMTERTLQAIQGGGGETSFELLSIPRDNSVNYVKTDFLEVGVNILKPCDNSQSGFDITVVDNKINVYGTATKSDFIKIGEVAQLLRA